VALIRLWKEKRGEAAPVDFSDNLVVPLGVATEALNRNWHERNTGRMVTDAQRWVQHPVKAEAALTNPEKSLVAIIPVANPREQGQTLRCGAPGGRRGAGGGSPLR
jgi:hypothetical protein